MEWHKIRASLVKYTYIMGPGQDPTITHHESLKVQSLGTPRELIDSILGEGFLELLRYLVRLAPAS